MRGKAVSAVVQLFGDRITPANAGKRILYKAGSIRRRITPANAGKRQPGQCFLTPGWDHPRECGEKPSKYVIWDELKGSPPRMRGKAGKTLSAVQYVRITPANAGKSSLTSVDSRRSRDHPRECGEKPHSLNLPSKPIGSPPRMRGKGRKKSKKSVHYRITPANAGKSCLVIWLMVWVLDHPRECGEKTHTHTPLYPTLGSPPRMRGKVFWPYMVLCSGRITPANAGKS